LGELFCHPHPSGQTQLSSLNILLLLRFTTKAYIV